jgi:hypothetical protein
VLPDQEIRFLLQRGAGGARDDPGDAAAVREMAVRRVDDRVDRLLEQVAADDLEQPARRDPCLEQDFAYFFFLLRGTFAPARRACDRPIAIACLRLFTFLPERPLLSVPRLRSCIAFLTFCCAFLPYLAIRDS